LSIRQLVPGAVHLLNVFAAVTDSVVFHSLSDQLDLNASGVVL